MTAAAAACLDELRRRTQSLATAESLTAGLVSATLADVPGASDVLCGGVAAYVTRVKETVLGVDPAIIARDGVVSAACAEAMADAARRLFGADWAVSTTGVAGPTEQEGRPVGTVFVAVSGPGVAESRRLALDGDRAAIRRDSVAAVLGLLAESLGVDGH